eukprot:Gb_03538 [translate_table: standard]
MYRPPWKKNAQIGLHEAKTAMQGRGDTHRGRHRLQRPWKNIERPHREKSGRRPRINKQQTLRSRLKVERARVKVSLGEEAPLFLPDNYPSLPLALLGLRSNIQSGFGLAVYREEGLHLGERRLWKITWRRLFIVFTGCTLKTQGGYTVVWRLNLFSHSFLSFGSGYEALKGLVMLSSGCSYIHWWLWACITHGDRVEIPIGWCEGRWGLTPCFVGVLSPFVSYVQDGGWPGDGDGLSLFHSPCCGFPRFLVWCYLYVDPVMGFLALVPCVVTKFIFAYEKYLISRSRSMLRMHGLKIR